MPSGFRALRVRVFDLPITMESPSCAARRSDTTPSGHPPATQSHYGSSASQHLGQQFGWQQHLQHPTAYDQQHPTAYDQQHTSWQQAMDAATGQHYTTGPGEVRLGSGWPRPGPLVVWGGARANGASILAC